MRRSITCTAVAAAIAAALAVAGGAAAGSQGDARASVAAPPPPGSNDFSCDPPRRHPQPVVLVHGTGGDRSNWGYVSPRLKSEGYCVFALDYGNRGRGPIQDSARELRRFVERVLQATDAHAVDIVGHSQGGMMPRYYAKFLDGTSRIADLVGLVPSNHGTTTPLAPIVGGSGECRSCEQQARGSRFLRRLNRGDETPSGINYTVVTTEYDEVVTPYTSAFLDGRRVNNVVLQRRCPANTAEHLGIVTDSVAYQWVENALGRPGPAREGFQPSCG